MLLTDFIPLVTRAATTNWTQAYSVAPTGDWDGNDGGWSTFAISVGTPPQYFRVLPSVSGIDTWIPTADQCSQNPGGCGVARGVEPFNAAPGSSPSSGVPSGVNGTAVDAGSTCTLNRSPMCITCTSINGACTNGPCAGRQCCGDPKGACQSACQGIGGLCTGQYIGCPCTGPDWNAGPGTTAAAATNVRLADGFLSDSSTSWTSTGTLQVPISQFLGVNGTAQYGTDTLGLGLDAGSGLTVRTSSIAGVPSNPFYLGTLGLKTTSDNSSIISALYEQKMIPSLSFGYTAGAFYQSPPILGSLTLGGYDASRVNGGNSQNLTSSLRVNDSMTIINVGSITTTNSLSKSSNVLAPAGSNLSALLDTSLPYFYFPQSICQAFETAFGLQWNSTAQVYTINATTHQQLVNSAPSVTFSLISTDPAPATINITLPYAAFDLSAAWPIFSQGTSYFPLRRSQNPDQIILGRTFMQEAYIFVDYQKGQYTISHASFPSNPNATRIVTVNHAQTAGSGASASGGSAGSGGSGISKGAIAGIVVGVIAGVALLCVLAFALWRSKRPHPKVQELPRDQTSPSAGSSEDGEPEKQGWTSYSPPPAFKNYKSDQKLQMSQRGPHGSTSTSQSPIDEKSMGALGSMSKKGFSRSNTLDHSLRSPTSPAGSEEKPHGRVVYNVNPWGNSELEDPRSPANNGGAGTNSSLGMYSIFDQDKPLPPPPGHVQELPGSSAAREICATKLWDYERDGSPPGGRGGRRPDMRRSQSAQDWHRNGHRREHDNTSPTNSAPGGPMSSRFGSPTLVRGDTGTTVRSGHGHGHGHGHLERGRFGSKSSLGSTSTSATRSPQARNKHIFELQADEPGNRSRRVSERERKRYDAASPTSI